MKLLCIPFLLLVFNVTDEQPILPSETTGREITTEFTYLPDSSKRLRIRDVLRAYRQGQFQRPSHGAITPRVTVYWLHFSLRNQTVFDQHWIADFQNWSYVDAYTVKMKE